MNFFATLPCLWERNPSPETLDLDTSCSKRSKKRCDTSFNIDTAPHKGFDVPGKETQNMHSVLPGDTTVQAIFTECDDVDMALEHSLSNNIK